MHRLSARIAGVALGVAMLGGCSSDSGLFGNSLTTQSIGMATSGPAATAPVAMAGKVDPACYSLSQRIDLLRQDGVTERIEKASVGKSATVSVKRDSLAKAAELDKANAEFQARCSTLGPRPTAMSTGSIAPAANASQVVSAAAPIAPPIVVQQKP